MLREGLIVGLANHTVLVSKDGKELPIADSGAPIKNDSGEITGVVLVFRDITEELKQKKRIDEREERIFRQKNGLIKLVGEPDIARGNLPEATKTLIETAAHALKTERTSIWLLSDDEKELRCIGLYEAGKEQYSRDECLLAKNLPGYLGIIRSESSVYTSDAKNDPKTAELNPDYLVPLNITSLLDAGIFIEGRLIGVFSFEHIGETREWHADDQSFASTMAAIAGGLIVQASRKKTEETLQKERSQLLSIFDSIDEAIYIADPNTYEIIYVNRFLKKLLSSELIGGKCYREFQGLEAPCEFCTNDIILKNKGVAHQWEHYNASLDRAYIVTNRIIKWSDERDVRFELAIDITDRKNAEKFMEQNRDWYRALAEDVPALITRVSPDGQVTYLNNASRSIIGKPIKDIIGKDFLISFRKNTGKR